MFTIHCINGNSSNQVKSNRPIVLKQNCKIQTKVLTHSFLEWTTIVSLVRYKLKSLKHRHQFKIIPKPQPLQTYFPTTFQLWPPVMCYRKQGRCHFLGIISPPLSVNWQTASLYNLTVIIPSVVSLSLASCRVTL